MLDLNKILRVFNACSTTSAWLLLTTRPQTEFPNANAAVSGAATAHDTIVFRDYRRSLSRDSDRL